MNTDFSSQAAFVDSISHCFTVKYVGIKTNEDNWEHDEWEVYATFKDYVLCYNYSKGLGLRITRKNIAGQPESVPNLKYLDLVAEMVLNLSYSSVTNFEDWAHGFGYSSDSIKALKIYDQCKKHAEFFTALIGAENVDKALALFEDY